MSNKIQIKRSAVPGKIPSTSDLDLGELGINTHDGALFLKKDDGTQSIIAIGAQIPQATSSSVLNTNYSSIYSNSITTTNTASATMLSQSINTYHTYDIVVQCISGSNYHTTKLLIIQDGTNAFLTEYSTVYNSVLLGTFDANIVSGNLVISVIPASSASTTFSFTVNMLSNQSLITPTGITDPSGLVGKGIVSINKTNTVGAIDTYTITYTDSTTSTFNVTNSSGTDIRYSPYTSDGVTTTYSCVYTVGYVTVHINGIRLNNSDYTALTGSSITLNTPVPFGSEIVITGFVSIALTNVYTKQETQIVAQQQSIASLSTIYTIGGSF